MCKNNRKTISTSGSPIAPTPATNLATSEKMAEDRFNQWKRLDPFPKVDAALLNSADILAYVKATSLIYPFDSSKLKGASYDVPIEGHVVYYDAKLNAADKKVIRELKNDGDYFDLPPNAIAFVTLQPTFRMPDYLALRFNLKITHIYKGLLLGTGPLVDPGFIGRLSIPLHNLTNNTYRFYKGDELITMEFTKMSSNIVWNPSITFAGHNERYIPNKIKSGRTVFQYITKALEKDGLNWIISSIPSAMAKSEKAAEDAKAAAQKTAEDAKELGDKLEKKAQVQAVVSIIAVCTLVLSAIGLSVTAINKANERYDAVIEEYATLEKEYSEKIDKLTQQIESLESQIDIILSSDDDLGQSDAPKSTKDP